MALIGRYDDQSTPGKILSTSGHINGIQHTNWQKEFPQFNLGYTVSLIETYCLLRYAELKESGAFRDPREIEH